MEAARPVSSFCPLMCTRSLSAYGFSWQPSVPSMGIVGMKMQTALAIKRGWGRVHVCMPGRFARAWLHEVETATERIPVLTGAPVTRVCSYLIACTR